MLDKTSELNLIGNPWPHQIFKAWIDWNNGHPWGHVNVRIASGLVARVDSAFIHDRHGLMLKCHETWMEDGAMCTDNFTVFASAVEAIIWERF